MHHNQKWNQDGLTEPCLAEDLFWRCLMFWAWTERELTSLGTSFNESPQWCHAAQIKPTQSIFKFVLEDKKLKDNLARKNIFVYFFAHPFSFFSWGLKAGRRGLVVIALGSEDRVHGFESWLQQSAFFCWLFSLLIHLLYFSLSLPTVCTLSHAMPVVMGSSMFDLSQGRQKMRNHRKILATPSVR